MPSLATRRNNCVRPEKPISTSLDYTVSCEHMYEGTCQISYARFTGPSSSLPVPLPHLLEIRCNSIEGGEELAKGDNIRAASEDGTFVGGCSDA